VLCSSFKFCMAIPTFKYFILRILTCKHHFWYYSIIFLFLLHHLFPVPKQPDRHHNHHQRWWCNVSFTNTSSILRSSCSSHTVQVLNKS
jgi:hypothetical protein